MNKLLRTATVAVAIAAPSAFAEQPQISLQATVTGNSEQPKVMYVLPWHAPVEQSVDYRPASHLAADLFVPVDRFEFARELQMRRQRSSAIPGNASGSDRALTSFVSQ